MYIEIILVMGLAYERRRYIVTQYHNGRSMPRVIPYLYDLTV